MSISIEKIMTKIEEEIKQAKVCSTEARMREKIYSIKTLCELVLDEQGIKDKSLLEEKSHPQTSSANSLEQLKINKLNMDNEANGDSLLDF